MTIQFFGLILILALANVCEGRNIPNAQCPETYVSCPCVDLNNESGAVKRCHEQSNISCFHNKDCMSASSFCLTCYSNHSDFCKECCCKNSPWNIPATHPINKRQAGDAKVCAKPVDPENGKAIFEASEFIVGEAVKYRCSEGYTLIGSATRHCNGNGKWAGELPTCEKLCSFPSLSSQDGLSYVENPGRQSHLLDSQGNVVLSEIEFKCDTGFSLIGPARMRCLPGGKWDRAPPTCRKPGQASSQCVNPGVLENGYYDLSHGSTYPIGSTVMFTCNAGYGMRGYSFAVCTDSGIWSSPVPKCYLLVTGTAMPITTTQSTTKDEDAVHCQKPFEPKNGSMSIKILNLSNRNVNLYVMGTSVEYQCNHPYKLDGQSKQFCLATGQWSGKAPICRPACGIGVEPKSPQIINGSVAKENGYPWQVALTTYLSRAEIRFIHCGGVVINEKWVLTAAHCITERQTKNLLDPNTFLLLFGKHFADRNIDSNDVISRKVSQLISHQDYNPWTFDSDLGLILLESDLVFNEKIMPLCLPDVNSMQTFQDGLKGVVTGWGNIDKEGTAAPVLMVLELPIVNNKKCEESYKKHNFKSTVTDNMFCAGEDEGGKNTCQGDSGGAMAFYEKDHYVLEGIVSWGNGDDCAAAGFFGGFVRVRNFVPWIKQYAP